MRLYEREWSIPRTFDSCDLIKRFSHAVEERLAPGESPVRFVVSETSGDAYRCEVGIVQRSNGSVTEPLGSIFEFRKRAFENTQSFNVVLLIPTGVHAEIGGHAG